MYILIKFDPTGQIIEDILFRSFFRLALFYLKTFNYYYFSQLYKSTLHIRRMLLFNVVNLPCLDSKIAEH